jgi:hypothetical protein
MLYLALGCIALAVFLWSGGRTTFKRREWRLVSGAFALAAFTGAAFVGIRGAWGSAIVLFVVGLGFLFSTRQQGVGAPPSREAMSAAEARSILGVGPDATRGEVKAAYLRLMRLAHPDKGGTSGLAAQLTAARDRLLGP